MPSPGLRLRPLREDELPAWLETGEAEYAAGLEHDAGLSREQAREKAARDTAMLLPDGLATPGHHLYMLEDDSTGETVGRLHWAERPPGSGGAWLFDVHVEERLRGQGLGKQAMRLFEEDVRARGLTRLELNVWGGNEPARGLYRSLGYREISVTMGKDDAAG